MSIIGAFTEFTYREIPLLKAMGMQVSAYEGGQLIMNFPLLQNNNDKGTGFAGALSSAATYCAWAVLKLDMQARGFDHNLAVVSSEIAYHKAVKDDFSAHAQLPAPDEMQGFYDKLEAKGKASLRLSAQIRSSDELAVSYSGVYVAFPKE